MRYIVCLLINVIIIVALDWHVAIAGILFALMFEIAVLGEMKIHDNRKLQIEHSEFWKCHPELGRDLYFIANNELASFGRAIMLNPKTDGFDVVDWYTTTPRSEEALSYSYSDIPSFVTKFSDFKEIVYGIVATLGSEALSKQTDNLTYKLHMLTLMQDQAVHDCAGVWLRREGRQKLRISVDNILHVYMEWIDVVSNKETNEHADNATRT